MNDDIKTGDSPGRFRVTLLRVMIIQVLTLLALWLIQSRYSR